MKLPDMDTLPRASVSGASAYVIGESPWIPAKPVPAKAGSGNPCGPSEREWDQPPASDTGSHRPDSPDRRMASRTRMFASPVSSGHREATRPRICRPNRSA